MLQGCLVFYTCVILLTGLGDAALLPDYEYFESFGWIRLHIIPENWFNARLRCNLEGGNLASPTTSEITEMMKTSMSSFPNISLVFVNVHSTIPKGNYTSIDGTPLSNLPEFAGGQPENRKDEEDCMVMDGTGELFDLSCTDVCPFFCFHNDHPLNKCNTISRDYIPEPRTGSCYKYYSDESSWEFAFAKCTTDFAHLAIINSEEEAEVLAEIFSKNLDEITDEQYCHSGFSTDSHRIFETVYEQPIEEAGFAKWEEGQPDNNDPRGENCGSMSHLGLLNDVNCYNKHLPFICETKLI